MAMGPERSKPLHNFSLPCLKWGNQRFLRCVKVASNAAQPQPEPSSLDRRSSRLRLKFDQSQHKQIDPRTSKSPARSPFHDSKRKSNTQKDSETNIEAVREKLTTDLRVAAKKLKVSILEEGGGKDEAPANAGPWNLRTRRAACKAPHEEEGKHQTGSSPMKVGEAVATKENPGIVEKNERAKFSIALSKKEVEQDFLAIAGTRPPRRPKKRPRIVQRKLDSLFPGLWLTEITAESYKVPDVPE